MSTTNSSTSAPRSGRLELIERTAPGIVCVQCDCGNILLLPESRWRSRKGCELHHAGEVARLEALEAQLAREEELRRIEVAKEARRRELNVEAHYEDLSKQGKVLFRKLSTYPNFDVHDIAPLLRADIGEAWDALLELVECNTVLELRNGACRPFSPEQPYVTGIEKWSTFKVRGTALRQLKDAEDDAVSKQRVERPEAEAAPIPAASPVKAAPGTGDGEESHISRFIAEACSTEPAYEGASVTESFATLRSAYCDWCEQRDLVPLVVQGFTDALTVAGFAPRAGRVRGLRVKLARESRDSGV